MKLLLLPAALVGALALGACGDSTDSGDPTENVDANAQVAFTVDGLS